MKKSLYLTTSLLFLSFYSAFSQNNKHIVGISSGITVPWENGIYIDCDQYVSWLDNKLSPTFSMFYEYQLSSYFKMGCHIDYENTKMEIPFEDDIKTNRFASGLHWIGQYPDKMIQAELGGFSNVVFVKSDDWDSNMKGIEYGIIIGPALSIKKIKIALHFQPTFSYFFSNALQESVLLLYPRIMCKLHYTL